MASGMEMMLKSMLGIDPEEIRKAGTQIQQAFADAMKKYDADMAELKFRLAELNAHNVQLHAKLDALLMGERFEHGGLSNGALPNVIASNTKN